MSLFMSESLKEKIDIKRLESDQKNVKIDSDFYCLFKTKEGSFYAPLYELNNTIRPLHITFDSEDVDQNILRNLLGKGLVESVSIFMTGSKQDLLVLEFKDVPNIAIAKLERKSLSGYNYLISIFISKA